MTYKLSLIPTGILRPGIDCVIGNGVVIHPPALLKEIETLAGQGVDIGGRLHVSDRAHVILPYHLAEERLTEESAVGRRPPRHHPARDRPLLSRQGRPGPRRPGRRPLPPRAVPRAPRPDRRLQEPAARGDASRLHAVRRRRPSPTSTSATPSGSGRSSATRRPGCTRPLGQGRRLLFEGAQGSLLDVDHGSYPYVTSSNSSAAGIAAGSGVPTRHIDRWIGDRQGVHHARRRRAVPDRAGQRDRRANPPGRQGVRHRDRPPAALRLVRRRRRPPLGAGQRLDRDRRHAARRPQRHRRVEGRRRLRGRRRPADRPSCPASSPTSSAAGRSTRRLPGWTEDITTRPAVGRPAPAGAGLRRVPRQQIGVPVSIVSVGPDRRQTILMPRTIERSIRRYIEAIVGDRDETSHGDHRRRSGPDRGGRAPARAAPAARRRSSWTATADGPSAGACRGSWATAGASRASGRSSRKGAGSDSTS